MRREKKMLLIIDVQNDFCPGGSLPVPEGDIIIPVINRLARMFPLVVATKDWHPEGHVSFASRYPGEKAGDTVDTETGPQRLWPDHCVRGSRGAEFHPDLDVKEINVVLHKGLKINLDSYSAFFENDHTTSTGLEYYCRGLGITDIYVTGLAEDVCVFFSSMDALRLGFSVTVLEDATRGVDRPAGSVDKALAAMKAKGARIITSDRL
ncbi:MAG TPA: bifunctional nicotinamidase/pyrazinamidase [Spirochaetia bacterium]|nr:bifunctional nicotinamidase/pyrazinamidase [Spirochaetia bacterium]